MQANTGICIVRKHTWQVPFRISMYEIQDGRKYVLLEGGKREAASLTPNHQIRVNIAPHGISTKGVTRNHAGNARALSAPENQAIDGTFALHFGLTRSSVPLL